MPKRTCSIDGCPSAVRARGWCSKHYQRWKNNGGPLARKPRVTDWADGSRTCNSCSKRMPIESFDLDRRATRGRRAACKDCRSEQMKAWFASNRARQVQRQRDRYARDHDVIVERDRARYRRDREKRIELVYAALDRRRAERWGVEFDPTVTRPALRERYGDRCHYCPTVMDFEILDGHIYSPSKATIEHQTPVARGGGHTWENCVLACWACNGEKRLKTPDEWVRECDAEGEDGAADLHTAACSA